MGEPESPVVVEPTAEPATETSVVADSKPSGRLLVPTDLRGLELFAAGWMFAGMALWILVLDPRRGDGPSQWDNWSIRDVIVTLTAAYCLGQMAQGVWIILLYQWELRGRPPVTPLTRNLGFRSLAMLACVIAVVAFALAPYRLDSSALALAPVSAGWLATGTAVGILFGPGLLLPAYLLLRSHRDLLRLKSRHVDFFAPLDNGRFRRWAAVAGMLVVGVVLGPCAEELLFRGVVYPGLRYELGLWPAVVLSALIFGLLHHKDGWWAVASATLGGVACALLVEGSGSLWPAVLAHVLVNSKLIAAYVWSFREPVSQQAGGETKPQGGTP